MALNHPNVLRTFISFPATPEARDQLKQKFYNKYGFPGVLGAVDGSHFPIFTPPKRIEHHFYCRKHYHSINFQMVCDHEGRILSINPKFGGAAHDAFVWDNSDINDYLQMLHANGESGWLLGDSGYPLRPWIMTPYSNPAPGTAEETYNTFHSRTRVVIEMAFGRLKNTWRYLCKQRVLHYMPDKSAQIVVACVVLHNLAMSYDVPAPRDIVVNQEFHRIEIAKQGNPSLLTQTSLLIGTQNPRDS